MFNRVSTRLNTIASRDQFKPIRIGENLVVNSTSHLKLYLNPLHRRFENAKKRLSFCLLAHNVTLLTVYHRIVSSVANQRTVFVIEREWIYTNA